MAPVVFGLDLKEMQWYKFKSSYMFGNKDYHLRRTKFVVYQLAMILCVVSESLGTDVISDYVDSQSYLRDHSGGRAMEHNDDYIGMASYNIWAGIFVAFIFGAAFFFDLFWPERKEDRGVRIAWKACAVMACVFMTASIILEAVIVSSRAAYVTGVRASEASALLRAYNGYPLVYNRNGRAVAGVVFAWLGWPFVIYSAIIMWLSIDHIEKYGPWSKSVGAQRKMQNLDGAGEGGRTDAWREGMPKHDGGTELNDLESGETTVPIGSGRTTGPMQSPLGQVSGRGTYPGT